ARTEVLPALPALGVGRAIRSSPARVARSAASAVKSSPPCARWKLCNAERVISREVASTVAGVAALAIAEVWDLAGAMTLGVTRRAGLSPAAATGTTSAAGRAT